MKYIKPMISWVLLTFVVLEALATLFTRVIIKDLGVSSREIIEAIPVFVILSVIIGLLLTRNKIIIIVSYMVVVVVLLANSNVTDSINTYLSIYNNSKNDYLSFVEDCNTYYDELKLSTDLNVLNAKEEFNKALEFNIDLKFDSLVKLKNINGIFNNIEGNLFTYPELMKEDIDGDDIRSWIKQTDQYELSRLYNAINATLSKIVVIILSLFITIIFTKIFSDYRDELDKENENKNDLTWME